MSSREYYRQELAACETVAELETISFELERKIREAFADDPGRIEWELEQLRQAAEEKGKDI